MIVRILVPALSDNRIRFASSTYRCASLMFFQPCHAINSNTVAPFKAVKHRRSLAQTMRGAMIKASFIAPHPNLIAETRGRKFLAVLGRQKCELFGLGMQGQFRD
jgi:hypothetical protein